MPSKLVNVLSQWNNQQLGQPGLREQRALVDLRIRTLRDSRKHQVVPWKNRPVGASSLSFDDAENRFLLCGSCVGDVSIIDMESPMFTSETTLPIKHTVYRSPISQRHRYLISGCQFYPVDSGVFVTASMDQEVRLWDSESMRVIDKYKNEAAILDVHWGMPNMSGIIAIALGSSCVRLIDPRTRNHIQHMRWKNKFAKCVRWMNTPSQLLLAGSETGNMVLWDVRSGRSELAELTAKSTSLIHSNERRAKPTKAHNCCVSSIRCSKDGRYVISMANDRNIHVWDALSMELEREINIEVDGQCTSLAEIGDEGNDLYGFVGVDKNLVVCRLTPNSNNEKSSTKIVANSSSQRTLRSQSQTSSKTSNDDQRVIRAHFQVVMSTAYRRSHQQVITSSSDGSTLVFAPEMDEHLPEQQTAHISNLHQDDFSDED